MKKIDIVIIGSGWAGICTMKHCLEENLSGIILEKTNDYGGVWNINNTPSVYANTYSVSSKLYLSMSDFPMPESYPEFPHHTLVMEYLRMYTNHFDILKYISFNSEVINIEKKNNEWHTTYNTNSGLQIIISKNIALCTGQNSTCLNYPNIDTSNFKGTIIHASKYDNLFKNKCLNKRVLIYGASDTGFDIGVELANNMYGVEKDINGNVKFGYTGPNSSINHEKTKIYISMKKGRWIQRRTGGAYEASDMYYSRTVDFILKTMSKSLIYVDFVPELELFWGTQGHGIKEWQSDVGYLNAYYIKSADILSKITFGDVIPLRDIKTVNSTNVVTVDNKIIDIDIIIFATGYSGFACYQFIPDYIKQGNFYDHIFLIDDPTIVKVGFIRPFLTSIPMIIEMQSRYIAKVFSNKCKLPNNIDMNYSYIKMKKVQSNEFGHDYERVTGIINPFDYMNMIAEKIDIMPSYTKLLLTDPILLSNILLDSWNHYIYRLCDTNDNKKNIAREQILLLNNHESSKKINKAIIKLIIKISILIIILIIIFLYRKKIYKLIQDM